MAHLTDLRRASSRHEREINRIAENFRVEVLVPLCRRHGLHFVSGMGSYTFWHGDTQIEEWNAGRVRRYGLRRVLAVLNEDLGRGSGWPFGYYVGDVKEGE